MASQRVFGLDLMRALAVTLVLVAHATFLLQPLIRNYEPWLMLGYFGVDLFFALSGFLVGGLLIAGAQPGGSWAGRFWVRRWLRTLPNYYLFLIINIFIQFWTDAQWPQAWRYALFVQNLAWPHPLFFQEAWSLALEEVFYFIAPLLVIVCLPLIRRPAHALWLLLAAVLAMACVRAGYVLAWQPTWDEGVRKISVIRLDSIGYGVIAVYMCKNYPVTDRRAAWLALGGVVAIAASAWLYLALPRDTSVFARSLLFSLVSAAFAALLPWAARWRESHLAPVVEGGIRRLALWSYGIYLTHLTAMRVMRNLGWIGTTAVGCVVNELIFLFLAIGSAAFVYQFYERPIMRLRDRFFPARAQIPNPGAERSETRTQEAV